MKHFIIDIIYKVEIEEVKKIVGKHREYLQSGYEKKILLCSGPKEPLTGGILIAKAENIDIIEEFISKDPYKLNNIAEYKITEFNPVMHQSFMDKWIKE